MGEIRNNTEVNLENYDAVNNPAHYVQGGLEVIDILRAKLSDEAFKGFLEGNIIKYVLRYKNKNGLEDLKKANWYLNYLIKITSK